jgi:hypothetical protein
VDPFLFEVVLVRGLLRTPREVRSLPMHLFLLEQRYAPPQRAVRLPEARPVPIRVAARDHDGLAPHDPFAVGPPALAVPRPIGAAPGGVAGAAPVQPAEPPGGRWTELRVVSPSGGIFTPDQLTGQTIAGRFCPGADDGEALHLHAPAFLDGPEFPVRIGGGGRLGSMSVAVHYELVRPGGAEVQALGFPATEEARVLGGGALDAARYGAPDGVELLVRVPRARLEALGRVRRDGAHNAALRLRIAVDAIDRGGRVVTCPSRTITYTGAVPASEQP